MLKSTKGVIKKLQNGMRHRGKATSADLRTIEQLLKKEPKCARLWCMRGNFIELSDDDNIYSIRDALLSYKHGIKVEPEYADSYIEAGYYHFNVRDDPFRALPYFRHALKLKSSLKLLNVYHEVQKEISERKADKSNRGLTRHSS
jgi:hypothetical protein